MYDLGSKGCTYPLMPEAYPQYRDIGLADQLAVKAKVSLVVRSSRTRREYYRIEERQNCGLEVVPVFICYQNV
jgi:hypothetical protein